MTCLSGAKLGFVSDVALVIFASFILYVIVDLGFGLIFPAQPYESHMERLTARAYTNEPYFSEEFLRESFTQPGAWLTPDGTRIVLPNEYQGHFFHIDKLPPTQLTYRRTINAYECTGSKVVLLLGGSTIYASEVPDEYTVASYLSNQLEVRSSDRYFVLNAGVSSSNTTQEVERLQVELSRGLRPAVVVSFSGANDIIQGIYFGNPEGVMFSGANRSQFLELVKKLVPHNIYQRLRLKAERDNRRILPPHLSDVRKTNELVQRTKEVFLNNVLEMQRLSLAYGFRFVICLQPYVLSTKYRSPTADVTEAVKEAEHSLPRGLEAFQLGHHALQEAIKELSEKGVVARDLSNQFADKSSDIFLDLVHVNSVGNKMLGEGIADVILTLLGAAKI